MRWHLLVLLVGVAVTVTHGYPFEKDDTTTLEESFAENKKDEVNKAEEEEETTGEKKESIAKAEEEDADEEEEVDEGDNEDDETDGDEENEKKNASITDYDEDVNGEETAKRDDVKATKEDASKSARKDAAKSPAPTKEESKKRDEHHHRHQLEKKTTAQKKGEDNSKKWWMVEGPHKWGGMGHSHWGPPHNTETENEHHDEGKKEAEAEAEVEAKTESKSHVPACCKSKDHKVRKRCNCAKHEEVEHKELAAKVHKKEAQHHTVKGHEKGYDFHDQGDTREHNNDKDHDLHGQWQFGYDGFGDDWGDWDHNEGSFEHLKTLEKESHGGNHEEYHGDGDKGGEEGGHDDDHGCETKRDCLTGTPVQAVQGPVGPVQGPVGPVQGPVGPLPPPLVGPVMAAPEPVLSAAPGEYAMPAMPVPMVSMPPPPVVQTQALPYRVCHSCHLLRDGGSRCLCKPVHRVHHRVHHVVHHAAPHRARAHFNHHVYIDCDAAVHNFPRKEHYCLPKQHGVVPQQSVVVPSPETVITGGKSSKRVKA